MKTSYLFFIPILSLLNIAVAQAQNLIGKIVNEANEPVEFANVLLFALPDSAFQTGSVSGADGRFQLSSELSNGLLKVSCIGYTTLYKTYAVGDELLLQLTPDTQILDEIVVKGNLPVTRMKNDALVTHVENSVLSKAGSANDVLEKLPGIVKEEDSYEVIGKGKPVFYINGRLVRDLSELEQLSSEEIRNVEVIQNPGARYDATVKAVIRIQTVRRQGEGWGINLRSSYYQNKHTDLIEQANMNYRYKNMDVFGMLQYTQIETEQDARIYQMMQANDLWEHHNLSTFESQRRYLTADLGINFQLNEKNFVGMKYSLSAWLKSEGTDCTQNHTLKNHTYYDNIQNRSLSDMEADPDHGLNLYYSGQINKLNIDFNADYYQDKYETNRLTDETSTSMENRNVHATSNVRNRLAAGKLVVSFPLGGGSLALGGEGTYTNRHDDYLNVENYVPASYSQIKEINVAGFAEYNRSFPWGDWSLGLRYEHVKFNYYKDKVRIDEQSRTFDNVFPNFSFNARLGNVQTRLSYTAKTVRPSYRQLSNNVTYIDRYSMQTGDPTLRPTFIHDVTLTGVWRFLQGGISFSQMKDWIFYWGDLMDDNNPQLMLRYRNWDKSVPLLTVFLSASPTIGCWSPMWNLAIEKQWLTIESQGQPYKMNTPLFRLTFNNTWELPKGFLISLDSWLRSKGASQNTYMEKMKGCVNISVRKSFLQDALSVELKGTDLFDTNREYNYLRSGYYSIYQENHLDRREFSLTVRYKFNTTKSKYKGTGAGTAQKNRM